MSWREMQFFSDPDKSVAAFYSTMKPDQEEDTGLIEPLKNHTQVS